MVRRSFNATDDSRSASLAEVYRAMSPAEQKQLIADFRAALRPLTGDPAPSGDAWDEAAAFAERSRAARQEPGTGRHIRFEHGQVKVLNSVRPRDDAAAWGRLAATARRLGLI